MAIMFYTITTLVNVLFKRESFNWIYVHLIGQIVPIAYFSSVSLTAFATFIPMQGRGNAGANPELLIALFAVLVGLLVAGFLTPAHTSPERFYVYHCTREFYHQNGTLRRLEGGFYVHPQDRYTGDLIRELAIKSRANALPLGDECEKELYCGIPFYQNSHHGQRDNGLWIKGNTFTLPETIDLQYIGNQNDSNLNTTTFSFTVKGTDHMSFYVSP
uniref:Endoplasmic reticulum metallopeptidase 1-like C-terminal domain-containing protein n=1 Tax=Anopheles maculatus TaxID=74869 RepID=A0A182SHV9_9DIPT